MGDRLDNIRHHRRGSIRGVKALEQDSTLHRQWARILEVKVIRVVQVVQDSIPHHLRPVRTPTIKVQVLVAILHHSKHSNMLASTVRHLHDLESKGTDSKVRALDSSRGMDRVGAMAAMLPPRLQPGVMSVET